MRSAPRIVQCGETAARLAGPKESPDKVPQGRGSWEEGILERRIFLLRRGDYTTLVT
jgi:hypothetical protein